MFKTCLCHAYFGEGASSVLALNAETIRAVCRASPSKREAIFSSKCSGSAVGRVACFYNTIDGFYVQPPLAVSDVVAEMVQQDMRCQRHRCDAEDKS